MTVVKFGKFATEALSSSQEVTNELWKEHNNQCPAADFGS